MKIFCKLSLLFTCIILSCNSETEQNSTKNQSEIQEEYQSILERHPNASFEEQAKLFIEENQRINKNEKYSFEIIKGKFNNDEYEDAVIAVNRYEYAVEKASKSPNPSRRAEIGFMGYENFFYFFDGATQDFNSKPTLIQSTPVVPLKISSEKITSSTKQDLIVEYRIRNSARINIYNFSKQKSFLTFNWKKFDGFGTDEHISNVFEFEDSKNLNSKNIKIFKGLITNNKKVKNHDKEDAKIRKENKLLHTFYFDKRINKYVTIKE